jgi:hypothetical protein
VKYSLKRIIILSMSPPAVGGAEAAGFCGWGLPEGFNAWRALPPDDSVFVPEGFSCARRFCFYS